MEVKNCRPLKVLVFSTETTMQEMGQYVRVKAKELHKDAINNDMEITGPVYWVYKGADGNPTTKFTLEICIPVCTNGKTSNNFQMKVLPEFKCINASHIGSWMEMGMIYQHLFHQVHSNNYEPNGETREIYINMDFENPENNITEIQVGIN